ncbi:MAG: type II toxin-antitoxin system RelB/DinJ family antitoxin [Phascolarctobacterium sp.]|nr:type II toxin-antitoxin system RelB/DinJ family antitoxin [Phascolarctobacterium sp.]
MEKTMTLNVRVAPEVKNAAESVLKKMGIPIATAIDIYLRKIVMTQSIPFKIEVTQVPSAINADSMSPVDLRTAIMEGYQDVLDGNVVDAHAAFANFREQHK